MPRPTFTFMLATRNRRDAARGVIDAVLRDKERYGSLELIVIDGDSTDGTKDMLASYGARVDAWTSVAGNGPYGAWNEGLSMAHGDYVRVLSDDDAYMEGALPAVADFIAARPGIGIVACGSAVLFGDDLTVARPLPWHPRRVTPRSFLRWPLWHGYAHESLFVARDLFARHGGWDTRYPVAADVELAERFLRAGASMEVAPIAVLGRSVQPDAISVKRRWRGVADVVSIMLRAGKPFHAAAFVVGVAAQFAAKKAGVRLLWGSAGA